MEAADVSADFAKGLCTRDGALEIKMTSTQLDNAGAQRWAEWAGKSLPAFIKKKNLAIRPSDGFHIAGLVDFSKNLLGDVGCHAILKQLFDLRIGCERIRLDHNRLGRATAVSLEGYVKNQPVPLLELHLSHNYFARPGIEGLVTHIGKDDKYPPSYKDRIVPLWLRLEANIIEKPEELFNLVREKMKSKRKPPAGAPLICEVTGEENGHALCSATACVNCKGGWCPVLHLTYIKSQNQARGIPNEASAWRDRKDEHRYWAIGDPLTVARVGSASLGAPAPKPSAPDGAMPPSSELAVVVRGEATIQSQPPVKLPPPVGAPPALQKAPPAGHGLGALSAAPTAPAPRRPPPAEGGAAQARPPAKGPPAVVDGGSVESLGKSPLAVDGGYVGMVPPTKAIPGMSAEGGDPGAITPLSQSKAETVSVVQKSPPKAAPQSSPPSKAPPLEPLAALRPPPDRPPPKAPPAALASPAPAAPPPAAAPPVDPTEIPEALPEVPERLPRILRAPSFRLRPDTNNWQPARRGLRSQQVHHNWDLPQAEVPSDGWLPEDGPVSAVFSSAQAQAEHAEQVSAVSSSGLAQAEHAEHAVSAVSSSGLAQAEYPEHSVPAVSSTHAQAEHAEHAVPAVSSTHAQAEHAEHAVSAVSSSSRSSAQAHSERAASAVSSHSAQAHAERAASAVSSHSAQAHAERAVAVVSTSTQTDAEPAVCSEQRSASLNEAAEELMRLLEEKSLNAVLCQHDVVGSLIQTILRLFLVGELGRRDLPVDNDGLQVLVRELVDQTLQVRSEERSTAHAVRVLRRQIKQRSVDECLGAHDDLGEFFRMMRRTILQQELIKRGLDQQLTSLDVMERILCEVLQVGVKDFKHRQQQKMVRQREQQQREQQQREQQQREQQQQQQLRPPLLGLEGLVWPEMANDPPVAGLHGPPFRLTSTWLDAPQPEPSQPLLPPPWVADEVRERAARSAREDALEEDMRPPREMLPQVRAPPPAASPPRAEQVGMPGGPSFAWRCDAPEFVPSFAAGGPAYPASGPDPKQEDAGGDPKREEPLALRRPPGLPVPQPLHAAEPPSSAPPLFHAPPSLVVEGTLRCALP